MRQDGKHKLFINKVDFLSGKEPIGMSLTHTLLINRYGHWLQALSTGELDPISPEQYRFIDVVNGKLEPKSDHEKAWFTYCVITKLDAQIEQICKGEHKNIKRLPKHDLVLDCVLKALKAREKLSASYVERANIQKGVIKVREHQNKGKSQTRFNITNYGGLHDFGL